MTISTQDSKVNYQGNGQTKVFQIPFPFLENNQIYVQKKDAQGNLINYTYATDYTVTGAGEENGGSVTLNVAPEQGSTISIYRDVPLTQEVDYRENEIFPAETHEEALDKLTMEVQQIQEQLDRSVKVDRFSDVDPDIIVKEIERVYDSTDNIDIVANNINDVNTVSDNISIVNTVAGNIDSVVTTATNVKDVNTVAQNKASINVTAANINDIKTVSSIKDIVQTVADNNTNITKVGTNISAVNTAASNIAAIQYAPTAATNAAQSAANAANSARISANSAIWAEGTDAQVAALGGVHSSKGWAEQSTNANVALTNSPYTTNRILEIPQNIKLELNNGTLTLKAGSKVYVPNGFEADGTTPKFDTVIISNDTTLTVTPDNLLSCFYTNIGLLYNATEFQVFSGGTAPTGQTYMTWYDTTNNIIKMTTDGGSTWVSHNTSFPVCILSPKSVIDQVFNGFGYIGSTVFALPGVKVQAPNGKNEDGTLKSIEYTTDRMVTYTFQSDWTTPYVYTLLRMDTGFPSIFVSTTVGLSENNYIVINGVEDRTIKGITLFRCSYTNGRINADYEPYTVDSVLNSSLSNLSATGQAKFDAKANTSLSNLDATGNAKFDAKANIGLDNLSAAGQAKFNAKANIGLDNLSAAGQAKFNAKANTDLSNVTSNIDYVIFSGVKNGIEIIEWKSGKIELFAYIDNVATAESGGTLLPLPYPRNNSKSFCCLSGGLPSTGDKGVTSFYCSFADDSNIKVVRDYYDNSSVKSCYTFAWYYRQK